MYGRFGTKKIKFEGRNAKESKHKKRARESTAILSTRELTIKRVNRGGGDPKYGIPDGSESTRKKFDGDLGLEVRTVG